MANWKYQVMTTGTDTHEIEDACEEAGRNGWELVTAIVVEASRDEWRTRLIFKREADERDEG